MMFVLGELGGLAFDIAARPLPVLGAAGWVRALGEACPAQASPIALVPGSSVLSEDIVFLLLVSTAGRSRSQSEGPARVAE